MDLMGLRSSAILAAVVAVLSSGLPAQVIQFDSGGLHYQTLSKQGVTVMFAHLPAHLKDYSILQVGVANGSPVTWTVRPEDFTFIRPDGAILRAMSARAVVDHLLDHASRNDVIKLISTYELTLNGVQQFRSTNGFEQRRESYLAELGSGKLKAAAAASAIAFVQTKLTSGESTDGAIFFPTKQLGPGRLSARVGDQLFEFESDAQGPTKSLQTR